MFDYAGAAVAAVAHGSPAAYALVYLAGLLSSTGPCAAPRVLAFASFMLRALHPARTSAAFLAGTLSTYALLGYVGGLVSGLVGVASWVYGSIAAAALLGGLWTLVGARWCAHDVPPAAARHDALGAAFLTGAGFSLVVSPCCTPLIGVVVSYAGALGGSLRAALLLVCFGLGHAAPVFATMLCGPRLSGWLATSRFSQGASIVAGAAMLILGSYYALMV